MSFIKIILIIIYKYVDKNIYICKKDKRMIIEAATQYRFIIENFNEIIELSGYKNEFIARKLNLSPANFSAKKSRQSFSHEEIEKILKIIVNEDVEDYFMLHIMRLKKDEESISSSDLKKVMAWK